MRLSEKRLRALYVAISGPLRDARVAALRANRSTPWTHIEIDDALYDLENAIWQRVEKALGLEP